MLINHNLSYHSEYGNTKKEKFKDWALPAFRDCGDKEKNQQNREGAEDTIDNSGSQERKYLSQ